MRKLKLNAESLRVESFAADGEADARGTVAANSFFTVDPVNAACSEPASQYCMETDYHWNTCGSSCIEMCFASNDPSCRC